MVHPLVNQPAPIITLPDANGKPFEINPGKSGVPTAIFFYPTSGENRLPVLSGRSKQLIGLDYRDLWLHQRSVRFQGCNERFGNPHQLS
jgi:hypothetical protein